MSGTADPLKTLPEAGLTPPGMSAADAPDQADRGVDPSHVG
jgi:hypothetical protein